MGDERAGSPDNPSPEQQQRLEAALSLLERNGELVFKLNGAMGTQGCPPAAAGLPAPAHASLAPLAV